jgi:hypothetical protein
MLEKCLVKVGTELNWVLWWRWGTGGFNSGEVVKEVGKCVLELAVS